MNRSRPPMAALLTRFSFFWSILLVLGIAAHEVLASCPELSTALPGTVYDSNSVGYNATQSQYWSLQEASLSPDCVIRPLSTSDVSVAVGILSTSNQSFAVKSGGHAPALGAANVEFGVTIDLSYLNATTLSSDHKVASIGAGARWLSVYEALAPFNVTVPGGRNGDVGVGGLTLGGGISYFGPRVGWTCDSVVNFEVVLADGNIVNANSTCNTLLFRALKGGSNNFGVVTRIDFATFDQGGLWGGTLVQSISSVNLAFEAFVNIASSTHYDVYAAINTILIFNSTETESAWTLLHQPAYTKPIEDPAVFDEILAIEPQLANTLAITTLPDLAVEGLSAAGQVKLNQIFYTVTVAATNSTATYLSRCYGLMNSSLYDYQIPGGILWSFAFETIPTNMTKFTKTRGGNVLGVDPDDGNLIIMLAAAQWEDTSRNSEVHAVAANLTTGIADMAREMGLLKDFQYLNYANEQQDPIANYGETNVEFLREVSVMYDPTGVFQRLVRGGFKI